MHKDIGAILNFNFSRLWKLKFFWILTGIIVFFAILIEIIIAVTPIKTYHWQEGYATITIIQITFGIIALIIFNIWNFIELFSKDLKNGVKNLEIRTGVKNSSSIWARLIFNQVVGNIFIISLLSLNALIMSMFVFDSANIYFGRYFIGQFVLFPINLLFTSVLFITFSIFQNQAVMVVPTILSALQLSYPFIGQVVSNKMGAPSHVISPEDKYTLSVLLNLEKKYKNGFSNMLLNEFAKNYNYYNVMDDDVNIDSYETQKLNNLIRNTAVYIGLENTTSKNVVITKEFKESQFYNFLKLLPEVKVTYDNFENSWYNNDVKNGYKGTEQFKISVDFLTTDNMLNELLKLHIGQNKDRLKSEMTEINEYLNSFYKIILSSENIYQDLKEEPLYSTSSKYSLGDKLLLKILTSGASFIRDKNLENNSVANEPAELFSYALPILNYNAMTYYAGNQSILMDFSVQENTNTLGRVNFIYKINKDAKDGRYVTSVNVERSFNFAGVAYIIDIFIAVIFFEIGFSINRFKQKRGGRNV